MVGKLKRFSLRIVWLSSTAKVEMIVFLVDLPEESVLELEHLVVSVPLVGVCPTLHCPLKLFQQRCQNFKHGRTNRRLGNADVDDLK